MRPRDLEKQAGRITPDEAHQIARRFNASHWQHHRDMGEVARYSIPANPRRDDDLRLGAFINQATRALVLEEATLAWRRWSGRDADCLALDEKQAMYAAREDLDRAILVCVAARQDLGE